MPTDYDQKASHILIADDSSQAWPNSIEHISCEKKNNEVKLVWMTWSHLKREFDWFITKTL